MCTVCQTHPIVIEKIFSRSDSDYVKLAIRSKGKDFVFTLEVFSIIPSGHWYWHTPGIHVCGCCMLREVVDDQIQWIPPDYNCNTDGVDRPVVQIGDELLRKAIKFKMFI